MLTRIRRLRTDVERQSLGREPEVVGAARERQQLLGVAAELAREIRHRTRAAEGDPQQQRRTIGIGHELTQLVGVVGHEYAHPAIERGADVDIPFDGVGVDAERRIDAHARDQLHLAGGRKIEKATLPQYCAHDRRMRQRLERIVQVDPR